MGNVIFTSCTQGEGVKGANGKDRLHLQGVECALKPGKTRNKNVAKLNEGDRSCWVVDLIGQFLGGDGRASLGRGRLA